jgi:hypothetical protein
MFVRNIWLPSAGLGNLADFDIGQRRKLKGQ